MRAVKNLHIVCFNVPYPVAHGGYFDLYYKIIALHKAGVNIHLHCFGENEQPELRKYCTAVYYYPREKKLSLTVPYIVYSRDNAALKESLLENDWPILLEGIHTTSLLNDKRFAKRNILLRLHNVEYLYYRQLFNSSTSFFKKIYYLYESVLLKNYERKIASLPSAIFAVSQCDKNLYERQFSARHIYFLPVFTDNTNVDISPGTGCFCLYHGNLSIAENEYAAIWLIDNVFNNLNIPLIVAGRNPSKKLSQKIISSGKVTLVANPADDELNDLIKKAQCHVLPSFNSTGVKLKLINALYKGRHCIVNRAAVLGSGMESICTITESAEEFAAQIKSLFTTEFTQKDISTRGQVLTDLFDNVRATETITRML